MNLVMTLADDNNINIYYTDTDSIHIDESGVEPLTKLYEENYNQKLIKKKKDWGSFAVILNVTECLRLKA